MKRTTKKKTLHPKKIKKVSEHKHKFVPAIQFDWRGESTDYGRCRCGETTA